MKMLNEMDVELRRQPQEDAVILIDVQEGIGPWQDLDDIDKRFSQLCDQFIMVLEELDYVSRSIDQQEINTR